MKNLLLLTSLVLFFSVNTFAQGPGFPGDGDVTDTPIDGGVSALIVGAAAYGAKRLKQSASSKTNT